MSRLRHCNIVALVGVCSLDEPLSAVLEYSRCGDLATFLRSNGVPTVATDTAETGDERHARSTLR